jgi:hypothetical protein
MHEGGWDEILMYIEMYCKEVVKAYVNDGRVVTTVNI